LILIDTSVLIGSLAGQRLTLPVLRSLFASGEHLLVPSIVLYEWWRGPRTVEELADQENLLPSEFAVPFGISEAVIAARLYRQVSRSRGREMDLAIAACAIAREMPLWTLNRGDFKDIPGLVLASLD
jgi:predicted nucleic acid-binding protein